jgi:hypothetical protein
MGVFQGNAGTSPNQSVFTSDIGSLTRLATSAPFQKYLIEEIFQKSAFVRSGILATDGRMNNTIGSRIEVPFFDPLDYTEENVQSSNDWGTNGAGFYTTQKTTASTQYATITTRGASFAMDDLSEVQTGENALNAIRSQLSTDMARKMEQKLLFMLQGIIGPAGPLAATNSLDVSGTDAAALNEANYLTAQNVVAAKYLLSERANDLNAIAMHPLCAAYLEQIGMLTFSTDSMVAGGDITWGGGGVGVTNTQIGWFAGLRVVVDSQMPIRGTAGQAQQFVSYLFDDGAIKTGSQFPMNIETQRNILSLQDIMAVTYNNVMHLPGVSWAASFDGPTNAQLGTPTNWSLAYEVPQLCGVVELVTNSPFGGTV